MECEVVTRTFAQGYTKIKKLPKKEILYHWTEDGHVVVLQQMSFLGKICKCRITRRILWRWKARDVRNAMVTKFLDSKKTDFWQNGKIWRNMMENRKLILKNRKINENDKVESNT